jgi:glutaredoxin
MPVTCPKCRHVRQPHETAPDWQCPACGVAYVKAAEAMQPAGRPAERSRPAPIADGRDIPWGKLILFFVFAGVVWATLQAGHNKAGSASNIMAGTAARSSFAGMNALASTVGPGDVVMYSTTECGYCTQARRWLDEYGFTFTECNMSLDSRCETEFRQLGARGTPYLVINRGGKTYHMKNGFDSDEFLGLLAQ